MRPPIHTYLASDVHYPSSLFSLERHEVLPYERLAYEVLHIGIPALNHRNLPESITVDFASLPPGGPPWLLNASIAAKLTGSTVNGFVVSFPELAPLLFHSFAHVVGHPLLEGLKENGGIKDPTAIRTLIGDFVAGANLAVREYRSGGCGFAVRAAFNHFGIGPLTIYDRFETYCGLSRLIANHEVAHAYTLQMTKRPPKDAAESRAFEILADSVAAVWSYRKCIAQTPDTSEYREFRGLNTYADCIYSNASGAMKTQLLLVLLMAIAGAQRTAGHVTLAGGTRHPSSILRGLFQHINLNTLVASNYSSILSREQLAHLRAIFAEGLLKLVAGSVLSGPEIPLVFDDHEVAAIETAGELLNEIDIPELRKARPAFSSIRPLAAKFRAEHGLS